MTEMKDLQTPQAVNWCPGCGNINIWSAFKKAAVEEDWNNTNTALVAGIGCHGHIVNFVKITSLEGLHGRPIPVATGVKIANRNLNVFAFTGDGDCFGEGGNHYIHACRRNHDITAIIHDNALYALTTGQTSPRSPEGFKTKSTPDGNPDEPFNPLRLAIISGATFVARAYAGDMDQLTQIIIEANKHKGMSVVDVLQPCVSLNKELTHEFYRENIYYLGDDYDPTNKNAALEKALEFGLKKIPLGIFYKEESSRTDEDKVGTIDQNRDGYDYNKLFKKYT